MKINLEILGIVTLLIMIMAVVIGVRVILRPRIEGVELKQLTDNVGVDFFIWAPDGEKNCFYSKAERNLDNG